MMRNFRAERQSQRSRGKRIAPKAPISSPSSAKPFAFEFCLEQFSKGASEDVHAIEASVPQTVEFIGPVDFVLHLVVMDSTNV